MNAMLEKVHLLRQPGPLLLVQQKEASLGRLSSEPVPQSNRQAKKLCHHRVGSSNHISYLNGSRCVPPFYPQTLSECR